MKITDVQLYTDLGFIYIKVRKFGLFWSTIARFDTEIPGQKEIAMQLYEQILNN